jgi:hypothetical protein
MGDVQRATRTAERKVIIRDQGALVYDLSLDPSEARPLMERVDAEAAETVYRAQLAPFLRLQAAPPVQLGQSPEEAARLEALGYQAPRGDLSPSPMPP